MEDVKHDWDPSCKGLTTACKEIDIVHDKTLSIHQHCAVWLWLSDFDLQLRITSYISIQSFIALT